MKQGRTVDFKQWAGINNVKPPEKIGPTTMVEGLNVFLDSRRRVNRREGRTIQMAGSFHSIYAKGAQCLVVKDGTLGRLTESLTFVPLRTGMGNLPVAYTPLNGAVYYSNGTLNGIIRADGTHTSWGIQRPPAPSLSAGHGLARPGTYRVLLTYVRSDGQESGSGDPAEIELTNGRIDMVLPVSSDPDVSDKVVYVTDPNGTVFWMGGVVANSVTTFSWDGSYTYRECPTMQLSPPPCGTMLAVYRGQILVGVGDAVYHTRPFSPELCDLSRDFKQLDGQISIMAPVEGGVYLSWGEKIGFAAGDDFSAAKLTILAEYGSIPGTLAYFDQKFDDAEQQNVIESIVQWVSHKGIVRGGSDGSFRNMTAGVYEAVNTPRGTALAMEHNGEYFMISTLLGPQTQGNVYEETLTVTNHAQTLAGNGMINGLSLSAA